MFEFYRDPPTSIRIKRPGQAVVAPTPVTSWRDPQGSGPGLVEAFRHQSWLSPPPQHQRWSGPSLRNIWCAQGPKRAPCSHLRPASKLQSLTVARHAFIAACSAAVWLADPVLAIEICPVESDITMAIQLLSACASGVAANATLIVIVRIASFFMGTTTLLRGTIKRDRRKVT